MFKQIACVLLVLVCVGQVKAETIFFDDTFPGDTLNALWTTHPGDSGSITVGGGVVTLQAAGAPGSYNVHTAMGAKGHGKNALADGGTYASGDYLRMTFDLDTLTSQYSIVGLTGKDIDADVNNGGRIFLQSRNTAVWFGIEDSLGKSVYYSVANESSVAGVWTIDWYTDRVIVSQDSTVMVDTDTSSKVAGNSNSATILPIIQDDNLYPTADCGGGQNGTIVLDQVKWSGTIPEPGTLVLLSMGLVGLLAYAWRKRK